MELQSSVPPQFKECKSLNKSEQQFLGDPLSRRRCTTAAQQRRCQLQYLDWGQGLLLSHRSSPALRDPSFSWSLGEVLV